MLPIFAMNDKAMFNRQLILLLLIITQPFISGNAIADNTSQRIEVYGLSQSYWDTKSGDTLSEIALHLLPNNPSKHESLMQDIVRLNPQAFINGNPQQLLADKRLQLPGYMKQADSKVDPSTTEVENFSWGNIKRSRR